MVRARFLDFRTRVQSYAQSIGSPLGVCITDIPALAGLVNTATDRWLMDELQPDEGWWGLWIRGVFSVSQTNPYLVLGYGQARAIVLDVCQKPKKIQNAFFEFLDYGRGLQPNPNQTCDDLLMAYDREYVPILGTLSNTPQFIAIYPGNAADVGKTFIVQGLDQNGNAVIGQDPVTGSTLTGEALTLQQPFIQSQHQYSSITGLQKDQTLAPVTIQQVDSVSGLIQPLSVMQASEQVAAYRRYLLNNLPCFCCNSTAPTVSVTAMVKVEYTPVYSDSDYLVVPNIPALIAECEAIRLETSDNVKSQQLAVEKHKNALRYLFGQLDHQLGKERPAITVPLFGKRRHLKMQPL